MSYIRKAVREFSHTEIKALPTQTSGVSLKAGKDGFIYIPSLVVYQISGWTADYTAIDGSSNVGVNINGIFTPPTLTGSGMFAQGHDNILWCEVGRDYDFTPADAGDLVGQDIDLIVTNLNDDPFTGGNAAQKLTVTVFFYAMKHLA